MTEFTQGIQGAIKKLISGSSLGLAIIYTLGHIVIAMTVVSLMTGASLWEAGAVALIEPSINGVWFYVFMLCLLVLILFALLLLCKSLGSGWLQVGSQNKELFLKTAPFFTWMLPRSGALVCSKRAYCHVHW